jgi:intraflagellar transport protein 81
VGVLNDTKRVLQSRAEDLEGFMKQMERERGIQGYSSIEEQIQGVSNQQELLNQDKDQTLQEITETVQRIEKEVKDRKQQLAPEIQNLRALRQRMQEVEGEHGEKKRVYDGIVSNIEQAKERIESEVKATFNDYRDDERKFHQNNIQTEIYDAFLKRIGNEAKFINQSDKRLTNEFKSYSEFFAAKLRQQENIIKDLKAHQKHIKDNADNFREQMQLFQSLRHLLETKRRTAKEGGDGLVGY